MFPEIRKAIGDWFSDRGNLLSLDLKDITFNTLVGSENPRWYLENGYDKIAEILMGGMPAWSGELVNIRTALQHPTVYACNKIISESVGYIPAYLMRQIGDRKVKQEQHPMYAAMLYEPNEEITAQGFSEMLTSHCVMQGDGFARIQRRSGTNSAIGLVPLTPDKVNVTREKTGQRRIVYEVMGETGAANKTYTVQENKPHDIFHLRGLGWDGLRGHSVIEMGRQSFGSAIASEKHLALFWAGGGRMPYLLKRRLGFRNDEAAREWRAEWERIYSIANRPPIIEDGTEYQPIGSSMRDAQGIENRMYTVADICRWFAVSPPLVHDLSRATFANIEELFLAFVKLTLMSWLSRWEQDFRRCVLTPEEKSQGYMLRHNIRELLRGDFKTRVEGYSSLLQNGARSIDEIREEDDLNPLPNGAGSHYHIQLNMGTIGDDGQVQAPESSPEPAPNGLMRLDTTDSEDDT